MPPIGSLSKTALALAMSQVIASPVTAATLTVNDLGDSSTIGDGLCTLREAIDSIGSSTLNTDCSVVTPGTEDTIIFADPVFATSTITLTALLPLSISNKTLTINAPTDASKLKVVQSANSEVMNISNSALVSINNLEISGGSSVFGAGISLNNATLILDTCTISANIASGGGGGIGAEGGSTVTISNSEISANTAQSGAGIQINDSSLEINSTMINGNYADDNVGGGLYSLNSSVTSKNNTFSFNNATTDGGAISSYNSDIIIDGNFIYYNEAFGVGGGISSNSGSLTIIGGTDIYENYASSGGGLNFSGSANVTIKQSLVNSNSVSGNGGGVTVDASSLVYFIDSSIYANETTASGAGIYANSNSHAIVNNSTISGNTADVHGGGVMANNGGTISLKNATVSDNYAGDDGGGLHISLDGEANFSNSILSGNSAVDTGKEIYLDIGQNASTNFSGTNLFGQATYNNVQSFANFTPTTPDFTASNDGNTPTQLTNIIADLASYGFTRSHPIVSGSPAIGKASTQLCPPQDQRGKIREQAFFVPIVNAHNKIAVIELGGECDIGATEFSTGDPSPPL